MKLLVTGGAGFIGSSVVRAAVSRGLDVLNLDCLTYASDLRNLEEVSGCSNYDFAPVNICCFEELRDSIFDFRPDAILHLAAESHVDRSIASPRVFLETNILGTFNLLESVREYFPSYNGDFNFVFHHVSTDEVFGSLDLDTESKFNESSPYAPRSPYSASKASSDHLVRAWNETFGIPTIITNCSNNYGPFHHPEKFIPVVITNCLLGRPIPIYGNGQNVRDWLYVDDHADALLHILQKSRSGKSYNIGGNNECSNLDLVFKICNILDEVHPMPAGSYSNLIEFVADRPGHDLRYAIDSSLMYSELGWSAKTSLDEGLLLTIKWFISNQEWWMNRC